MCIFEYIVGSGVFEGVLYIVGVIRWVYMDELVDS